MKQKYIDVYGNGKYLSQKSGYFWRGRQILIRDLNYTCLHVF